MNFQAPYNRTNYIDFLRNTLLPEDFEKADESIRLEFKPQYTRQVTKFGHSPSLEMNIYEVEHGSENDPRVSLSKESFRLLAEHGQKRALVLFISKASANYRLSLVTIDLKWEEGKRPTKEYSNPKRLSFFLGPDAKIHTPQEYLVKPGRVRDFDDLKNRFSIEVVTKEFYEEYAEVFAEIENAIAKNNKLSKPDLRLYTQMLMNRLMFLRFLEKKKWVKFGKSSDYLANLYAAGRLNKQSFFITRLCPLFFEALAIEGKQESDAVGKTAFLNGGLFERSKLDEKVQDIPDAAFKNLLGPDGLFYKFNFTVEESTPIDIEVSVDPEMLGKVFEELVTGRHETGSYYTPRPIVSFMCKEALKGYLSAKTSASKEAISLLVDEHQIASDLTNRHAEEILFYLETIKAVDPACGSGAYLLGLLQELIEIRKTLQNQQLKSDPDFIYNLKLRLISHCLYGVDIDPFATNIAKLRLWLSLSVEADNPQPLPNLDFKIETGDSILGPCDIYADRPDALVMSRLRQKAQQLVLKKDRYMLAHGEEKQKLYDEILAEEKALAEQTGTIVGEGVIAWHIHFSEVFTRGRRVESTFDGQFGFMAEAQRQRVFKITSYEPGGFDIVLANPPYIRQELITEIKPELEEVYPRIFSGRADLYVYFFARSIELLSSGGMLIFISSNKWFKAGYGKKLRKCISDDCQILSIIDFGELPVFETSSTFPSIFIAQKGKGKTSTIFTQVKSLEKPYPNIQEIISEQGITLSCESVHGEDWKITSAGGYQLVQKMESKGVPLIKCLNGEIFAGIKTGLNEAFWVDEKIKNELIRHSKNIEEVIKPLLVGNDIRKWHVSWKHKYLIYTYPNIDISNCEDLINYLKPYKNKLSSRALNQKWYELQQAQFRYAQLFPKPKIVYPDIAKESRFALDSKGFFIDMTAFSIPSNSLFLLGLLNSKVVWKYISIVAAVLGDAEKRGRLRLKRQYLSKIPIPKASSEEKQSIAKLVQSCLNANGENCEQWERQIDQMVYKLYGLTPDEIAIIKKTS